jgi:cell division protein FtsB
MKGAFVQNSTRNPQFSLQPAKSNPNITSAVGMQETAGSLRAKRHSLFTQTVIWVTGVICMAFLLGSLTQAWSNSQLAQKVEAAQQQLSQLKDEQKHLNQLVNYYKDNTVIEREAREQLGYVRPKEHLVVMDSPHTPTQQPTSKQAALPPQHGFWLQWWNLFFGD